MINYKSPASLTSALLIGMLASGVTLVALLPKAQAQQWSKAQAEQATLQELSIDLPKEVIDLRLAIIGQESGGNFLAVNPHSGALGYGQVMPKNVGPWSKQALGYSISTKEFLHNPTLQIKIINYKLKEYWQKARAASGGNEILAVRRVAAHWYSGRPHLYTSTRTQYYRGHRYPSIARYTLSVLAKYQQQQRFARVASGNLRNSLLLNTPPWLGTQEGIEEGFIN